MKSWTLGPFQPCISGSDDHLPKMNHLARDPTDYRHSDLQPTTDTSIPSLVGIHWPLFCLQRSVRLNANAVSNLSVKADDDTRHILSKVSCHVFRVYTPQCGVDTERYCSAKPPQFCLNCAAFESQWYARSAQAERTQSVKHELTGSWNASVTCDDTFQPMAVSNTARAIRKAHSGRPLSGGRPVGPSLETTNAQKFIAGLMEQSYA
jgi:hypothetical protein